ncbi:uncharacterized protein LOC114526488 [Dendronephthya gigantea]|uniref:uncharacterized protein LOC114526488 n=1 Tax=Dendronephthya gigantea TaxID=151771 RepID=UPI001069A572|nr:uncharacterized protein LOC114526488 [Dendronephthya gigantea]
MMTILKFLIAFITTLSLILRCDIWVRASEDMWPSGSYSLPKPISGCPNSWKEGWLRQHLDEHSEAMQSSFSSNFHMNATLVRNVFLEREFCTKISANPDSQENIPWPKGFYCVYRKQDSCPDGMANGTMASFDEDQNIENDTKGFTPDYYPVFYYTSLFYCCQNRGKWYNSIQLPTEKPFYLLPYGSRNCQRVLGAVSSLEYIVFDTKDQSLFFWGHRVFTEGNTSLPKIFYCYYEGCQHKLHSNQGSFASSNYFNRAYPDFQLCFWSITVNGSLRISLRFPTLHVPDCNNNYLDIYDGMDQANGSARLLRYCGENATSGTRLTSKTNQLFITFKSGNNTVSSETDSSKALGFYAEYKAFAPTATINNTVDGGRKELQNSSSGNTVIYVSVILPSIAILVILGVLAAVFYRRRCKLKLDVIANRSAGRIENMQTAPTSKSYTSSTSSAGRRVTSKSNINPIYESNVNSLYELEPGTIEIRNATENILYESGNETGCAVYESAGNEIFEANPIYQGIDGDSDVDLTYSEPIK